MGTGHIMLLGLRRVGLEVQAQVEAVREEGAEMEAEVEVVAMEAMEAMGEVVENHILVLCMNSLVLQFQLKSHSNAKYLYAPIIAQVPFANSVPAFV